jgi:hypothetical protein
MGEQAWHFDTGIGPLDRLGLSFIFYNNLTKSTSMPRFPLNMLKGLMQSKSDKLKTFSLLDNPRMYHTVPVEEGSLMLFHHSVPHHGSKNNSEVNRAVTFGMVSDAEGEGQDSYQVFPWTLLAEWLGESSLAYYQAVQRNWEQGPLERESGNAAEEERTKQKLEAQHKLWAERFKSKKTEQEEKTEKAKLDKDKKEKAALQKQNAEFQEELVKLRAFKLNALKPAVQSALKEAKVAKK